MPRTRLLRVMMAVCCVVALGTLAASLESTVASGPLDGVDPNWSNLPLTEDDVAELKDALDFRDEAELDEDVEVDPPDVTETPTQTPPPADVDMQGGPGGGAARGEDGPASGPDVAIDDSGSADGSGSPGLEGWLGPLLVVAAFGAAYRYRRRLRHHLGALDGWQPGRGSATSLPRGPPQHSSAYRPEHAVDRAWLRLVRELDDASVRNATPAECAQAAKAAGMAPGPVETLQQTFEEVRYGGKPVTAERRRRVHEGLDALHLELDTT